MSELWWLVCVGWTGQKSLVTKKTLRIICAVIVIGVASGVASRMGYVHARSKVRIGVEKDASDISGLAVQRRFT